MKKLMFILIGVLLFPSYVCADLNADLLQQAITGNNSEVQKLLASGADVNATHRGGRTALYHAVLEGHTEVVKTLLGTKGIDVNKALETSGWTPLHVGIEKGRTEIVAVLIERSPSDLPLNVNKPTKTGQTPLIFAIIKRNVEIVNLLLSAGADVNKADNDGNTPLHVAASMDVNTNMVILLLEVPGIEINQRNKDGNTPLGVAADWQTEEELEYAGGIF